MNNEQWAMGDQVMGNG